MEREGQGPPGPPVTGPERSGPKPESFAANPEATRRRHQESFDVALKRFDRLRQTDLLTEEDQAAIDRIRGLAERVTTIFDDPENQEYKGEVVDLQQALIDLTKNVVRRRMHGLESLVDRINQRATPDARNDRAWFAYQALVHRKGSYGHLVESYEAAAGPDAMLDLYQNDISPVQERLLAYAQQFGALEEAEGRAFDWAKWSREATEAKARSGTREKEPTEESAPARRRGLRGILPKVVLGWMEGVAKGKRDATGEQPATTASDQDDVTRPRRGIPIRRPAQPAEPSLDDFDLSEAPVRSAPTEPPGPPPAEPPPGGPSGPEPDDEDEPIGDPEEDESVPLPEEEPPPGSEPEATPDDEREGSPDDEEVATATEATEAPTEPERPGLSPEQQVALYRVLPYRDLASALRASRFLSNQTRLLLNGGDGYLTQLDSVVGRLEGGADPTVVAEIDLDQIGTRLTEMVGQVLNRMVDRRNSFLRHWRVRDQHPSYQLVATPAFNPNFLLERFATLGPISEINAFYHNEVIGFGDRLIDLMDNVEQATRLSGIERIKQGQQWLRGLIPGIFDRNTNPEVAAALGRRVDRERVERQEQLEQEPTARIDVPTVKRKMVELYRAQAGDNLEEQVRRNRLSDEQLFEEIGTIDAGKRDELAEEALVTASLESNLSRVRTAKEKRRQELSRKTGALKILALLGTGYAGTCARGFLQNGLIGTAANILGEDASKEAILTAARTVSGVSGAVIGGIGGAAWGAYGANRKARRELYDAGRIISEIGNLETRQEIKINGEVVTLSPQQKADLIGRLLVEKKLYGEALDDAYEIYRTVRETERRQELAEARRQAVIAMGENAESLSREERLQYIADALNNLLANRVTDGGSEHNRRQSIIAYQESLNDQIKSRTFWGGVKGGVIGSGVAGVFGYLFPAATLVTKINTEIIAEKVTATIANMGERIGDLQNLIMGGAPETIIAESAKNANIHDMLHALTSNNEVGVALAKQIGMQMGGEGHSIDMTEELVKHLRQYGEYVNQHHVSEENAVRGLHHLLSHSQAVINNFDQFLGLVGQNAQTSGEVFTQQVIQGGPTSILNPFVTASTGNDLGQDMRHSIQDYVLQGWRHTGDVTLTYDFTAWPVHLQVTALGAETPWDIGSPTVGLWGAIASSQARLGRNVEWRDWSLLATKKGREKFSEKYKARDWWNKGPEGERPPSPENEVPKGREGINTKYEGPFNEEIFDKHKMEHTEDQPLKDQLEAFKKMLESRHGYFVIKGKKAYRIWTYSGEDAKAFQKRPKKETVHNPNQQGTEATLPGPRDAANVGQVDGGVFYAKEYDLKDLYRVGRDNKYVELMDQRGLTEKWQPHDWPKATGNGDPVNVKTAFSFSDHEARPLIIHPMDIDKYAYAVDRLGHSPTKKIGNDPDVVQGVGTDHLALARFVQANEVQEAEEEPTEAEEDNEDEVVVSPAETSPKMTKEQAIARLSEIIRTVSRAGRTGRRVREHLGIGPAEWEKRLEQLERLGVVRKNETTKRWEVQFSREPAEFEQKITELDLASEVEAEEKQARIKDIIIDYFDNRKAVREDGFANKVRKDEDYPQKADFEKKAQVLLELIDDPGEAKLEELVHKLQDRFNQTMNDIALTPSNYGTSESWAYYHIADECGEGPDGTKSRAIFDESEESTAIQEKIVDEMVGWELRDYQRRENNGQPITADDPERGFLAETSQATAINKDIAAKEESDMAPLYIRLGQHIREAVAEHEKAKASEPEDGSGEEGPGSDETGTDPEEPAGGTVPPEPANERDRLYPEANFEALTDYEAIKTAIDAGQQVYVRNANPPHQIYKVTPATDNGKRWKAVEINEAGEETAKSRNIAKTQVEEGLFTILRKS